MDGAVIHIKLIIVNKFNFCPWSQNFNHILAAETSPSLIAAKEVNAKEDPEVVLEVPPPVQTTEGSFIFQVFK